jgi:hypothetical protein
MRKHQIKNNCTPLKETTVVWGKVCAGDWHFDYSLLPKRRVQDAIRLMITLATQTVDLLSEEATVFVYDSAADKLDLRSGKEYAHLEAGCVLHFSKTIS